MKTNVLIIGGKEMRTYEERFNYELNKMTDRNAQKKFFSAWVILKNKSLLWKKLALFTQVNNFLNSIKC